MVKSFCFKDNCHRDSYKRPKKLLRPNKVNICCCCPTETNDKPKGDIGHFDEKPGNTFEGSGGDENATMSEEIIGKTCSLP